MKNNSKFFSGGILSLGLALSLFACARKQEYLNVERNGPRSQTAQQAGETPASSILLPASSAVSQVVPPAVVAPIPCKDRGGQVISGQFTDPRQNTRPDISDCFDQAGVLVYPGTSKTCMDELSQRFGPDVLFPAQSVLPGLYKAAALKGAGGQQFLKDSLSTKTCRELLDQYPG